MQIKSKELRSYTEKGEIQSVSIQGSYILVVVRLDGEVLPDMMGNPVRCGRFLVGAPRYAPESTLTMAELLIPINFTFATPISDPKKLIGEKVQVFFREDGFPDGCILLSMQNSRTLGREYLFNLRKGNQDYIFDDLTKKDIGNDNHKLEEFKNIKDEVYDPEFHKGMVGTYGDKQNPFVATKSHMHDLADFSVRTNESVIVTDATRKVREKDCYMPTTVFTGR